MKKYFRYVDDVNTGRVLACEALTLAVSRFERDLAASKKRGAKWIFDEAEANQAIGFIECLVQFEDQFAGIPITLEPWECFFIAQLFGWRNRKTGRRRFRKALLFMARKQGKTILAAAILLYELLCRPGIEVYSLATKQAVANKGFRYLSEFIAANPDISALVKIHKSPKSIFIESTSSVYVPLSSDGKLDGFRPVVVHIDELAAMTDGGRARRTLLSGMGSTEEPLELITSTASDSLENPLIEEYEYAKQVLDGTLEDDATLVAIYEIDKADKWDDLSVMQKSCPNLGVSVSLEYLAGELKKARLIPAMATEYKTKYCNIFIASDKTWIPDKTWNICRTNRKTHAEVFADLSRLPCYLSLDLSTIWDYTALTRTFYSSAADKYLALHRFYIPKAQVETKVYQESSQIREWIAKGFIVATPGESIDSAYLYADIDAALKAHKVLGIVYDPAKAKEFESTYQDRADLVVFKQVALNMSPAAKAWEKGIVDGKICDDNPVMRWMLSNAINKVNPDSGSYFITKNPTSKARRRIDGVITSIMAYWSLSNWVLEDSKPKPVMLDLSKIRY